MQGLLQSSHLNILRGFPAFPDNAVIFLHLNNLHTLPLCIGPMAGVLPAPRPDRSHNPGVMEIQKSRPHIIVNKNTWPGFLFRPG